MASSETPWERGRLARILLKNAGKMPAFPAKNEVFGACLMKASKNMYYYIFTARIPTGIQRRAL